MPVHVTYKHGLGDVGGERLSCCVADQAVPVPDQEVGRGPRGHPLPGLREGLLSDHQEGRHRIAPRHVQNDEEIDDVSVFVYSLILLYNLVIISKVFVLLV